MTVSMRVMSAGDGYKYLLKSVAAGDGDRSLSTPLTRYYAEAGTPPGFWMGSGLGRLGHGELVEGAQVSEAQLALLIGMVHDPITGVACHEHGTGVAGFLPCSWDHLDCQLWDHPARRVGGPVNGSLDRCVGVAVMEVYERGIQGGQCG